jgi:DNA-binding transcriptional ArsR family regulator
MLDIIGEPARIQILFALGNGDSCVCHLVNALHMRQASISQHLMVLRQADIVDTQREGRHVFYSLSQPAVLSLLQGTASMMEIPFESIQSLGKVPVSGCTCPKCNPSLAPHLICKQEVNHG